MLHFFKTKRNQQSFVYSVIAQKCKVQQQNQNMHKNVEILYNVNLMNNITFYKAQILERFKNDNDMS